MSALPPASSRVIHEPGGRWFDDFEVGQIIESTRRTVTEADIGAFAGLSGDYNPLHTDHEHASRTPFRGVVAHGLLVQSVASGLANQTGVFHGTINALKSMQIDFTGPVRAGDTIRIRMTVLEVDPEPAVRRGTVRFRTEVTNQEGEQVIDGYWLTVISRRPAKLARRDSLP